jgi:hypothetical protein
VNSWVRTALALVAVLVVGLPALVSASSPTPSYPRPRLAAILGPEIDHVNKLSGPYSLYVLFTDGSSATLGFPPAVLSLNGSQVSGDRITPAKVGIDVLTGKYTASGGSVTAKRIIIVVP